jgi:hypothetical protein
MVKALNKRRKMIFSCFAVGMFLSVAYAGVFVWRALKAYPVPGKGYLAVTISISI